MEEESILKEIENLLKAWKRQSSVLRYIHVGLGLIAIISSVTVASRLLEIVSKQLINPYNDIMLAAIPWLAAISIAILTSMGLEAKSNNMRTAWRILNAAVLRYREDHDMKKLLDAYERGEEIIGDVKVSVSKT